MITGCQLCATILGMEFTCFVAGRTVKVIATHVWLEQNLGAYECAAWERSIRSKHAIVFEAVRSSAGFSKGDELILLVK